MLKVIEIVRKRPKWHKIVINATTYKTLPATITEEVK
jgi:hypothetical protein